MKKILILLFLIMSWHINIDEKIVFSDEFQGVESIAQTAQNSIELNNGDYNQSFHEDNLIKEGADITEAEDIQSSWNILYSTNKSLDNKDNNQLNNDNQQAKQESLQQIGDSNQQVSDEAVRNFSDDFNSRSNTIDTKQNISNDSNMGIGTPTLWNAQWDVQMITDRGASFKYLNDVNSEVNIAVIDSGVNTKQFNIKDNFSIFKNYVPKGGYNGEEENENGQIDFVEDLDGHGTAVVAQIIGNSELQGIYPKARINIYRIFGQKLANTEWVVKAIRDAINDGNDIINLSFGKYLMISGEYEDGTNDLNEFNMYKEVIDYAIKKGVVIVSAAGNDSLDLEDNDSLVDFLSKNRKIKTPGQIVDAINFFTSVISVGGIDINGEKSDFSNYKEGMIYSPAGTLKNFNTMSYDIFFSNGYYLTDWIITQGKDNFQFLYGNSLASAKVSGIIAAVIAKYNLHKQSNFIKRYIYDSTTNVNGLRVLFMTKAIEKDNLELSVSPFYNDIPQNDSYKNTEESGAKASLLKIQSGNHSDIITLDKVESISNSKLPSTGCSNIKYEYFGIILIFVSISLVKIKKVD